MVAYAAIRYWPNGNIECLGVFFDKEIAQAEKDNWDGIGGSWARILRIDIPFNHIKASFL